MEDLQRRLSRLIASYAPQEGVHASRFLGIDFIRYARPGDYAKGYWRSSVCIVAQGCKELMVGNTVYRFDDVHYIVTPVDLPVVSRVAVATPERPFLCMRIVLDPTALREVDAQLDQAVESDEEAPLRGVFVGSAGDKMMDAAVRLAELLQSPADMPVLGALTTREIFYHLLKGVHGPAIRQVMRAGTKMHQIAQAIYMLKTELAEPLDVPALARAVNMSRSAFFKHFKDVTGMSPIQFQKRFRLLEARRLMVEERESAEGSAFKVGYKSPSQFSREYVRMFGDSPLRDAKKLAHDVCSSQ